LDASFRNYAVSHPRKQSHNLHEYTGTSSDRQPQDNSDHTIVI